MVKEDDDDIIPIDQLPEGSTEEEDDIVSIEELPEGDKPESKNTLEKATRAFSEISKMIPLSDRIKQAGLVGRGVEALENGLQLEDAPYIAAKMGSGALQGIPEFMANNPMAGAVEQGAKILGASKDRSLFPKAVTKEGKKLGDELGIAASFATVMTPVKDVSIGERITKSSVAKMKESRETIANATKDIVKFDSKVRGELFGARVKAGNEFDASLKAVQKAAPNQKLDLTSAFKGLGVEIDEAGQITAQNPKLLSDLKTVLKRSGNRTLERVLETGDASNLTLEQSQQIIGSIKKIPSLAQKLNQGKFAQYSDTDIPILQFIEDVRDAQLSAFPEFEKTLGAYREVMHKFRTIRPYFKEANLIKNITSQFQGKPVINKFVSDLLPKETVKQMENVRKAIAVGRGAKDIAVKSAKLTGAGLLVGAGFEGARRLF
jgi:hypothetical protein